jgi:hypothetical protein
VRGAVRVAHGVSVCLLQLARVAWAPPQRVEGFEVRPSVERTEVGPSAERIELGPREERTEVEPRAERPGASAQVWHLVGDCFFSSWGTFSYPLGGVFSLCRTRSHLLAPLQCCCGRQQSSVHSS